MWSKFSVLVIAALAFGTAQAQDNRGAASSTAYQGVVPGSGNDPLHLLGKPGQKPARITWPGFQMFNDGSSRLFVQMTDKVVTIQNPKGKTYELIFSKVVLPGSNNKRALITEYFNTPVLRAKLKKRKQDVVLQVDLRGGASPNVTSEQSSTGYYFVYLNFPAGDYVPVEKRVPFPVSEKKRAPDEKKQRKSHAELDKETPPGTRKKK